MTNTTFKVGQRVKYTGRILPSYAEQEGWVTGRSYEYVLVHFDSAIRPKAIHPDNLTAI